MNYIIFLQRAVIKTVIKPRIRIFLFYKEQKNIPRAGERAGETSKIDRLKKYLFYKEQREKQRDVSKAE